jgi:hypothetical protein
MRRVLMKKYNIAFFLLLVFYLSFHFPQSRALEKTLEIPTWGCRYEVYVEAPDTWQTGTQIEVTVRLTLIQKGVEGREISYVSNHEGMLLHWWLTGGKNYTQHITGPQHPVRWVTVEHDETMNLTEEGDYWEKQFQGEMYDRAETRLGRGETANATFILGFLLEEFSANHTLLDEPWVGDIFGNIIVFRPLLSMIEAVVLAGISAIGAILAFLIRSGRLLLFRFFSTLSTKYPFLTRVGSSMSIVAMWVFFVTTMYYSALAREPQFSLAIYIAFALVAAVFVILTVGLLEFILEGWGMLQTGFGFIVVLFILYILYLAVVFLTSQN